MKTTTIIIITILLTSLLAGCGGGGNVDQSDTFVTRQNAPQPNVADKALRPPKPPSI